VICERNTAVRLPVLTGRPRLRRMEMNQSFNSFQSTQPGSPERAYGAKIYTHPDDVTSDPKLTTAERRAVLASWISDARAVENAPSSRQLDSGAIVEVDDILQALVSLDEPAPDRRGDFRRLPPSHRGRSVISKWFKRGGPPTNSNDNDDDPPTAPAGVAIPFRPKPLSPAHSARPQWVPELACAAG
jgi:hypothetical protein